MNDNSQFLILRQVKEIVNISVNTDVSAISNTSPVKTEARTQSRENWYMQMRHYIAHAIDSKKDPHFIAMGMAVGVFIGCTPTMPFHTILAVSLAFILQGSKAAAALGTWVCNPLTMPFLYLGSFKIGRHLLGPWVPFNFQSNVIPDFLKSGIDATMVMVAGGIVLGIVPGVAAYFICRYFHLNIRKKALAKKFHRKQNPNPIGS